MARLAAVVLLLLQQQQRNKLLWPHVLFETAQHKIDNEVILRTHESVPKLVNLAATRRDETALICSGSLAKLLRVINSAELCFFLSYRKTPANVVQLLSF